MLFAIGAALFTLGTTFFSPRTILFVLVATFFSIRTILFAPVATFFALGTILSLSRPIALSFLCTTVIVSRGA